MTKRTTALVAFAAALAFGLLPAAAAADPEMDLPENPHFSVSGGEVEVATAEFAVKCAEVTGTGEWEDGQTGTVQFTYKGCKGPALVNCTTSGQSTGTITTTELQFHLKTVTEDGSPAVLVTPNGGHFVSFTCFVASVVVTGNGVIGEIVSPGYGEESSTATISFAGTKGEQALTTIEGSETEYGLQASINGGEAKPAAQDVEGQIHFEEGQGILTGAILAVEVEKEGTGTVTSTPGNTIDCTTACASTFPKGTEVTLEAKDKAKFEKWETIKGNPGGCTGATNPCKVTVNSRIALKAHFK